MRMQLPLRFGAPVGGRVRSAVAIAVARGTSYASRATGHHATALPGFMAERIDPGILATLGSRHSPIALVIGTNGKTTTTRLLATILERAMGRPVLSNRSGANLSQGIVTALLARSAADASSPAVFEVDELAFPRVAAVLRPDVVVILNLVRDQLDRYGEVDAVERRLVEAFRSLPSASLVVCADDPRLEAVVADAPSHIRWFGLGDTDASRSATEEPRIGPSVESAVRAPCPRCGAPTDVDDATASVGAWRCTACGHRRPPPELAVHAMGSEDGWLRLGFELRPAADAPSEAGTSDRSARDLGRARVRLAGTAGAHDAAAAVLGAIALGLDPGSVVEAIDGATPAFGRLEEVMVGDRTVVLSLAKNPSSVAQAAEAAAIRRPDWLLLGLGDRAADGRDVSWIWDAHLDALLRLAPLTLTGSRADDLALRFKYADVHERPPHQPIVDASIEHALTDALGRIRPGGTLMVLATYTTLLRIRHVLERRGLATAMPV